MPLFHLAFPVHDLEAARDFYGRVLGCPQGREAPDWIDFNLGGHQIVAHLAPDDCAHVTTNAVDGEAVPVRHFGLVLEWDDWHALKDRLDAQGADFLIAPTIRFEGRPGEQATFFIADPSGNALEFKAFRDPAQLFAV